MTLRIKSRRRMALSWPAALACLMLAGCGALRTVTEKGMVRLSPSAEAVSMRVDVGTPMIDVAIPARNVAGPMARISLRSDVSEWRSTDGIGLTLQDGQIIATRGFGADLLIADAQGAASALRHGGGEFSRTMHWLDGENHDQSEVFVCTMRAAKNQTKPKVSTFSETCIGSQTRFSNTYVMSPNTGGLIRSDQWVSSGLGHIQIEPH